MQNTKGEEQRRHKAKQLRYRKALVREISLGAITDDLWEIQGACEEVRWYWEGDDDTLINVLDGDEDDAYEFKMMFADLCAECDQMSEDLRNEYVPECFDDLFVAARTGDLGGGYLGWDSYEQDYFGISRYEGQWSEDESRKRMMRLTKEQLLDATHACLTVLYSYLGLRHRYDCLKAALDILRDQNTGYLQMVKKIDEIYGEAEEEGFRSWSPKTKELNDILNALPPEAWVQ